VICISLHEPYAAAMATLMEEGRPIKANETRHWPIEYRGPLAIHAAKLPFNIGKADPTFAYWCRTLTTRYGLMNDMRFGEIVCIVWIVDCKKVDDIIDTLSPTELMFGNYKNRYDDKTGALIEQRYAWITDPDRLKRLYSPVAVKGFQKFWDWKVPEGLRFK
jgi:hypothetical protein